MIDSFHSSGNASLFQTELINLWISEQAVLPPALNNSAGTWPGDLYLFLHLNSHLNLRDTGLRHYWLCCMYFRLPKIINPCTCNSWEKWFLHPTKILWESVTESPFSFFTLLVLHKSLIPLYKAKAFLITVSFKFINFSFEIILLLALKCLLASCLTLSRQSTLLLFWSCNHCILACLLWSKKT